MGYPTQASTPAGDWLRKNPRSHPLGQILLDYEKADGSALVPEDIQKPQQTLDLWRGVITSKFEIDGNPVKITTVYPMIAMTAARLGHPETAVEILLREGPNNKYLPNGHCPQRSDEAAAKSSKPGARKREIAVYLPANGAFLSAVAMMAAGWDGNTNHAPGFPNNGKWKIRCEGLKPLP